MKKMKKNITYKQFKTKLSLPIAHYCKQLNIKDRDVQTRRRKTFTLYSFSFNSKMVTFC